MRTGEFVQTSSELAEFAPELAEFAREFVQSNVRVRWKGILCILMMIHRLDFTGFEPSIFNFYSSVAVLGRKK